MIIQRYIARTVLRPLLLGLLLLTLVFTAYSSAEYLAEAAAGQLPPRAIATLIGLHTLIALEVLLPTALYLSVVAGLHRLHRDGEMTALQAAGVGEWPVLGSVLAIALVIAACVSILSLYGRPWAYRTVQALERELLLSINISNLQAGHFQRVGKGRHVIFAEEIDDEKRQLRRVFFQLAQGEKTKVIYARQARLRTVKIDEGQRVEFLDGYAYDLDRSGPRDLTVRFNRLTIRVAENAPAGGWKRKAVPSSELRKSQDPKDVAEMQWRLSTPVATVLLVLLGVPLARATPKKARLASMAVAVGAYALLFYLLAVAKTWVENQTLPMVPGIWWVHGGAAILLLYVLGRGHRLGLWHAH